VRRGRRNARSDCRRLSGERADIEGRILELEPVTANVIAARILIEGNEENSHRRNFHDSDGGEIQLMVLEFVRPSLSGLLRDHVQEILDNPKTPEHLLQAMLDRAAFSRLAAIRPQLVGAIAEDSDRVLAEREDELAADGPSAAETQGRAA
jgi:hypothetical protein